jgi:AraC-like DNA-binding protein
MVALANTEAQVFRSARKLAARPPDSLGAASSVAAPGSKLDPMRGEQVVIHAGGFVHVSDRGRDAGLHALPLHKLVVPLGGAVLTCVHADACFESRSPLLVRADFPQSVRSQGPSVAIFVPAVSEDGVVLRSASPLLGLDGRQAAHVAGFAACLAQQPNGLDGVADAMALVRPLLSTMIVERRIASVVRALLERDPADPRPALAPLAARVGISASRLSHLFMASTGITLRSWLSFDRVVHSVQQLARTRDLAAIASASGFSDQPHLSRVWRAHFGRTPRAVRSAIVQDGQPLAR